MPMTMTINLRDSQSRPGTAVEFPDQILLLLGGHEVGQEIESLRFEEGYHRAMEKGGGLW